MNNEFIKIYANFLKKFLKPCLPAGKPARPLEVIFDCSNGTTGIVLKNLLKPKTNPLIGGLKPIFINTKPNGNFPAHGPNPLMPNVINQLQKEVIKQKADLGIIFDADGDRVFFVDNKGKFINPDIIANLLIWRISPKKVVIDIRTGWLVRKEIMNDKLGIKNKKSMIHNSKFIIQSRVGHYYIKKLMRRVDADFGAEQSGHYYFKNFFYCDSGIMAAIEVINAVSKLPYSLTDFNNLLSQYFRSGEINIKIKKSRIKNQNSDSRLKNLFKLIKKKYSNKAIKISHIDGLTMEFSDWWFNLRPSNTEPLIRLNIETNDKNLLQQKIKELKNFLNKLFMNNF